MRKENLYIEIVSSSLPRRSSMSRQSRDAACDALRKYYSHVRVTMVDSLSDLEALVARRPDLVFLGMQSLPTGTITDGYGAGNVWVSEYLDRYGIAYTGSNYLAHKLEVHKPLAKQRVLRAGLATAPFAIVRRNELEKSGEVKLTFPLFVKPTDRGGGVGVDADSLVYNFEELQAKVESIATKLHADSLVEEYLPGREFSVAILSDQDTDELIVMPIELRAPEGLNGESVLGKAVKTSNTEQVCSISDKSLKKKISELASDAYRALGGRDYGRIDIRLNGNGIPQFLEANLIPSLISGYGSFPKACLINMEMSYEEMLLRIVALALSRVTVGQAQPLSSRLIAAPLV